MTNREAQQILENHESIKDKFYNENPDKKQELELNKKRNSKGKNQFELDLGGFK